MPVSNFAAFRVAGGAKWASVLSEERVSIPMRMFVFIDSAQVGWSTSWGR